MRLAAIAAGLSLIGLVGCGGHHGSYHGGAAGSGMAGHTSLERGKQDMANLIDKTITDPAKAQRVKELSEQIVKEAVASSERSRASHEKLYTLNARYDATPEEFTKVLDELNNNRMSSAAQILALRFRMKETLTADEWTKLTTAMNDYRMKYHHGKGAGSAGGY